MSGRPIIRNFPFEFENGKSIFLSSRLPTFGGVFPSRHFGRSGNTHLDDPCYNVICHPKLVETGLDLLAFPTIYFYETGYSLHTLRQASRRSWRIGQRFPVRVKFVTYLGTMQETCLRLMGKKMLVALMMEGKF
jgi:hypothetical protein